MSRFKQRLVCDCIAALVAVACCAAPGRCAAQECRRLPPSSPEQTVSQGQPGALMQAAFAEDHPPSEPPNELPRAMVRELSDRDEGGRRLDDRGDRADINLPSERWGRRGSDERLIDRLVDPTAWLMEFRFRDETVSPLNEQESSSSVFDSRAQIPFVAFGQVNVMRVDTYYNNGGDKGNGLGQTTLFDLIVFDASWGRWAVGPSVQVNPASSTEQDTLQAGPAFAAAHKTEHWTVGVVILNYLSNQNSETQIQPILAYKFNDDWALGVGDFTFTYNWNDGAWTSVPLACALEYIADIRGQKVQFFVNPQYNFRNSSGNAEWQVYFGFTILVPEA